MKGKNMIEIKAPDNSNLDSFITIFLAGSIEMGKAEPWQDKLANTDLANEKVILFNPRRTDWDSTWIQDPTEGTQFHRQVTWELDHIEKSDIVVFYFDPKTQSPITLLELGSCIGHGKNIIVCCPDGYFRKGNVVIACRRIGVEPVNSYDELVEKIKERIADINNPSGVDTDTLPDDNIDVEIP
jgi:nucleoside 2-deoxyribosyltransferase